MPHPSRAHLDAIGIPVWVRRGPERTAQSTGSSPESAGAEPTKRSALQAAMDPPSPRPGGTDTAGPTVGQALESIDAQVRECRKCELHRTRKRTVFGVGRPGAACMFIGEAPGAEEDARGEPFVGRAGKLLDAMLAAIGLTRGDVYIANIVKCRPPRNRDPRADEVAECSGYLRRQIEAVSPRLLVAVGRVAAQSLLSTTKPIGQLRGRTYRYGEDRLPVMVMYHPAYFLRSPLEKRKGWDDLVRLRAMLSDHAAGGP